MYNMKPKEKAQELFDKYYELVSYPTPNWRNIVKQSCIIAVDEMLNADWFIPTKEDFTRWSDYWKEVKKEIDEL